jgi:hypothetical protein
MRVGVRRAAEATSRWTRIAVGVLVLLGFMSAGWGARVVGLVSELTGQIYFVPGLP